MVWNFYTMVKCSSKLFIWLLKPILEKKLLYMVFIDNEIKFAVEIKTIKLFNQNQNIIKTSKHKEM